MSERQDDAHDEHVRRAMPDDFLEPPPIARELSEAAVAKVAPSIAPVEVMQAAVVSMKHLSEEEALRDREEWPGHTHESEYGFVVHVGLLPDEPARWPGLFAAGMWARAHGLEWVRFDRDADEQPGLPIFDW